MFSIENILLMMNGVAWFGPPLYSRGVFRTYLFVISIIFSGSYWIGIIFFLSRNLDEVNVYNYYTKDVLYYSLVAACSFYIGLYLIIGRRARLFFVEYIPKYKIEMAWGRTASTMIFVFLIFSSLYSVFASLEYVNAGDRVYFMDQVSPFWYSIVVPFNSLLIAVWVQLDRNLVEKGHVYWKIGFWLILYCHVFLVGFDGGRRASLLPLFAVTAVICMYNLGRSDNLFKYKKVEQFLLLLALLLSSLLALNRNYNVGWTIFNVQMTELVKFTPDLLQYILAPSSTLHVNTQMIELVEHEGAQGYLYYFIALGNTLFPRFIFQRYFFGDPLVVVLHDRFGWYGQDFGFLAEAIYAGGLPGVILLHLAFGLFLGYVVNCIVKRTARTFLLIFLIFLVFGMINSLRSDFMNILKAVFYPTFGVYFLIITARRIKL